MIEFYKKFISDIHFSTDTLKMTMNTAVMDWLRLSIHVFIVDIWSKLSFLDQNENVNRPHTSRHMVSVDQIAVLP